MSRDDATELKLQMLTFWQNLAVNRQGPCGDSPFARLYCELERALAPKAPETV